MSVLTLIARLVFLSLLVCSPAVAQQSDTLSFHHARSGYVFFANPDVRMQAARFVNPAPGYVRQVSVALGGFNAGGTARLRIFGHEGGGPAPVLEEDLIEPVILRKSRHGFEWVVVTIPERPFVGNNQFFIAVDQIDSGVVFLSDKVEKQPFCSSGDDLFYFQLLKEGEAWRWEKYAFAVEVILDYPTIVPERPMSNVAHSLGIEDTIRSNRSLAWADVNGDDYLDLLWDGRLYLNREGEVFEEVGKEAGLKGTPAANALLDFNNDGETDILFIGSHDSTDPQSRLFLGAGDGEFVGVSLDLPPITAPTSFSIADVNRDGYPDLFVGQSSGGDTCSDLLLLNSNGTGFVDASARIHSQESATGTRTYGSQFVDVDQDRDQDLYIARRYPERSVVLYNDGTGTFAPRNPSQTLHELGSGAGGDWKDFDNDGDVDLLYPRLIHPYLYKYRDIHGSSIYVGSEKGDEFLAKTGSASGIEEIIYEERHAGGSWGDVNNDGLLDAFFGTFGDCRFAELYTQNPDHTFSLNTFDYGLHWSSGGEDGIWVDYDNDGNLDLCVIEWNGLRLYRNPGDDGHHSYVEIDPVRHNGGPDLGASVTVHAGGLRITREVTVGRGILMGDSPRLHYGLGVEEKIDSVVVLWSNGMSETFADVEINKLNRLEQGSTGRLHQSANAAISAVPNPFKDQLNIYYTLPQTQRVRLEIYNQAGALVRILFEGKVSSGSHSVVWEGDNDYGESVPPGVYIYRLVLVDGEISGRAVLTR